MNKRSRHTSLVGGYARSSLGIQLAYLYKVEGGSREHKEQAQGGSQGSAEGRVRGRVQGRPGRGVEVAQDGDEVPSAWALSRVMQIV